MASRKRKPVPVQLPVSEPKVTLYFKTEAAKRYFLGQLSDGWGENVCYLDWPKGTDVDQAMRIDVRPLDCDGEEVDGG